MNYFCCQKKADIVSKKLNESQRKCHVKTKPQNLIEAINFVPRSEYKLTQTNVEKPIIRYQSDHKQMTSQYTNTRKIAISEQANEVLN